MVAKSYSPIVLADTFSILPTGVKGPSDTNRLKNPDRRGMLIEEIRFGISNPAGVTGGEQLNMDFGGALAVDLKLGRLPITNGFVPIWNLCKSLNGAWSIFSADNVQSGVTGSNQAQFTWVLPKPLYVPSGEIIVPNFYLDSTVVCPTLPAGGLNGAIAYAGRSTDMAVPEFIDLPYADVYIERTPVSPTITATVKHKSQPPDLINATPDEVKVQRLIGRCVIQDSAGGFAQDNCMDDTVDQQVSVRIYDSGGDFIIRDFTPWSHVFSAADGFSWDAAAKLRPRGYYIVETRYDVNSVSSHPDGKIQPMVALIGHRKVRLNSR